MVEKKNQVCSFFCFLTISRKNRTKNHLENGTRLHFLLFTGFRILIKKYTFLDFLYLFVFQKYSRNFLVWMHEQLYQYCILEFQFTFSTSWLNDSARFNLPLCHVLQVHVASWQNFFRQIHFIKLQFSFK